jgi:RNA polymerase sigma-70 factor
MPSPLAEQLLREGRRAWPDVELDPGCLETYLEARASQLGAPTRSLADLFLACACLNGGAKAQQHLEALCSSALRAALRQLKTSVDEKEALATLLTLLLVAEGGNEPRLAQYRGRSALSRWLQVVAGHHVLKTKRWNERSENLYEALLASAASRGLLEWKESDATTREVFKRALAKSLDGLDYRDRILLRMRLDGLSMIEIAKLFKVRHNTVSRWLARVNLAVERAVRRELRDTLRLQNPELDSLVRSMLSQVDTSLRAQVSQLCKGEEK